MHVYNIMINGIKKQATRLYINDVSDIQNQNEKVDEL